MKTNYPNPTKEIKDRNSQKKERIPVENFSQTFDYVLKDITKFDDFH